MQSSAISVPHTLVTETCAPIRSSGPNGVNDYKQTGWTPDLDMTPNLDI